jgi:N-acetylglutamate synthase-like GNAT family acetyltransferase
MMHDITIRAASRDDALELAALLTREGAPADPASVIARLGRLEATGLDQVLIAEARDQVVGLVSLHITPALISHEGPSARITALAVDEGEAHGAVGERLVAAVEELARAVGCTSIEASSYGSEEEFYAAIGYSRSHTLFRKTL